MTLLAMICEEELRFSSRQSSIEDDSRDSYVTSGRSGDENRDFHVLGCRKKSSDCFEGHFAMFRFRGATRDFHLASARQL